MQFPCLRFTSWVSMQFPCLRFPILVLHAGSTTINTKNCNNRYIRIQGAFPTSLGEITMDTTVAGGITYVTCSASFQFTTFEIASSS